MVPAMLHPDIRKAQEEIQEALAYRWKLQWCIEHHCVFHNHQASRDEPDILSAPEPTDKDLGINSFLSVHWGSGYLTITLAGLAKLPVSQRNKIYKIGGMKP